MVKKIISIILIEFLCLPLIALTACGCKHEETTLISDTATCEELGMSELLCKNCNKTIKVKSNPKGHDFSVFVEDTATCNDSGFEVYKCKNCNKKETRYSASKGHDYHGCMCTRCEKINPDYKKVTIRYDSGKFNYTETFYGSTSSSVVLVSFSVYNDNNKALIQGLGKLYFSGVIKMILISASIYDENNVRLGVGSCFYATRSGEYLITDECEIELTRKINNNEICYIALSATYA